MEACYRSFVPEPARSAIDLAMNPLPYRQSTSSRCSQRDDDQVVRYLYGRMEINTAQKGGRLLSSIC